MSTTDIIVIILIGICVIAGSGFVLLSTIAMARAKDGLTRVNALSPATGFGMPLVVIGAFIHTTWANGFSWQALITAVLAVTALIIVSSLASNTLARATYLAGAAIDPRTSPQDLGEDPQD